MLDHKKAMKLWEQVYGKATEARDYKNRLMGFALAEYAVALRKNTRLAGENESLATTSKHQLAELRAENERLKKDLTESSLRNMSVYGALYEALVEIEYREKSLAFGGAEWKAGRNMVDVLSSVVLGVDIL